MVPRLVAGSVAACLVASAVGSSSAGGGDARLEMISRLKNELHKISREEANARLESLGASAGPPPPRQDKIDHFVVLFMENQATDVFAGCMDRPGLDSLKNARIPKDPTNLSLGYNTFNCHKEYICTEGPMYDAGMPGHPTGRDTQAELGADSVIDAFGPDQIPVKVKIAEEFAFFNRLYSAVPAASSPNHLFAQTATSCGIVSNIPYKQCGGSQQFFPPLSIYDSLTLHNVSFGIYYNSTCGLGNNGSCFGPNSPEPTRGGVVSQYYGPDVNIDGVWRCEFAPATFLPPHHSLDLPVVSLHTTHTAHLQTGKSSSRTRSSTKLRLPGRSQLSRGSPRAHRLATTLATTFARVSVS